MIKFVSDATGRLFSPVIPVSSTNKTVRHDITEILLKVALNTINQQTSHQIADVKLWAEIFCGFHIELRSPNPNVHSGFLKAEFSKVRKFQIIRLYFVLGRDIHIAQFHLTDYTHKIS